MYIKKTEFFSASSVIAELCDVVKHSSSDQKPSLDKSDQ